MKNALLTIFIIIGLVLTGCSAQGSPKDIAGKSVIKVDENTYSVTVPLNLEAMEEFRDKSLEEGIPNPFGDLELLRSKEIVTELEFNVIDGTANVKGIVSSEEGSYNFNGSSIFLEFVSPDTENVYYYGDIKSVEGFNYLAMFSVEDNRAFIETPVPVEIGDYKGHLMFGEKFTNKEYWEALYSQNQ